MDLIAAIRPCRKPARLRQGRPAEKANCSRSDAEVSKEGFSGCLEVNYKSLERADARTNQEFVNALKLTGPSDTFLVIWKSSRGTLTSV